MGLKGTYDGPSGTSKHHGAVTVGLAIKVAASILSAAAPFFML